MTTIALQRLRPFEGNQQSSLIGPVTLTVYTVDNLGRVVVDTQDSPYLIASGWGIAVPGSGSGTKPTSGTGTLDFGAFPGSPEASVVITGTDVFDPNAVLSAWIVPAATADHTIDEHIADPPRVIAVNTTPGTSITVYGFASGRDLPVPPGTSFGQATTNQMPIAQQQLMPYGKWNVGWAFSP